MGIYSDGHRMAVTLTRSYSVGGGVWRVEWTSNLANPTFRVYRNGKLALTTPAYSANFKVAPGEQLSLEILDGDAKPAPSFPGTMRLEWQNGGGSIASYRIEEWNGSQWNAAATLLNAGQWQFSYTTRFLEDCATHRFRVVPIGNNGNPGTPAEWSATMVRHPDAPRKNFVLDTDNTVIIS